MAGNSEPKQAPQDSLETREARDAEKEAARPRWYRIAKAARPQLCKYGQKLFDQQKKLEEQSKTPTTDLEIWNAIDRQLRDELTEEFQALDALQRHVETFTHCDQAVIEQLFAGLETEEERLAVILASHVKFPQVQAGNISDPAGEEEDDDSVVFQMDIAEAKRKKNADKRRRQKENLKKRKADPELQRAAEEARRVNETNAELRRLRRKEREAERTAVEEAKEDEDIAQDGTDGTKDD